MVILLAAAAPALAQPDEPPPDEEAPDEEAPDEAPDEDSDADPIDRRARALFVAGDLAYARGHYDEAVAKFEEAYELSKRPQLLFNLGNAFERKGAWADAARVLRRYVASPDAHNPGVVRQRIRSLDARATARKDELDELAALRARPPCPDPVRCPVDEDTGPSDTVPYALIGAGGVALVAASGFGVAALRAGNDADSECLDGAGGRLCPDSARDALDREKTFSLTADLVAVAGVATVGAGVYLMFRNKKIRKRKERRSAEVAPAVVPGGVGVTVGGRF